MQVQESNLGHIGGQAASLRSGHVKSIRHEKEYPSLARLALSCGLYFSCICYGGYQATGHSHCIMLCDSQYASQGYFFSPLKTMATNLDDLFQEFTKFFGQLFVITGTWSMCLSEEQIIFKVTQCSKQEYHEMKVVRFCYLLKNLIWECKLW